MHVSAKVDYAIRALAELAAAEGGPLTAEVLATRQGIPSKFLQDVLATLRRRGLIQSQRGAAGGYWLARRASEISLADVIRAIDGPLSTVRGERPEDVHYAGAAEQLQKIWIATRCSLRAVVEKVTIADLEQGHLADEIAAISDRPDAWAQR